MAGVDVDSLTDRRPAWSLPIEITALTAILALALALLAGAGAALYQRQRPNVYLSSAVLLIDQPTVVATAPDSAPLQKLQLLRYQYADLLQTQVIANPVSRQLNNLSVARIETDLTYTVDPTSFTIDILATDKSPALAAQIAQAASATLINHVAKSQARIGVPASARVVLDELSQPSRGIRGPISNSKTVLAGAIAFIIVGGGFLIIADLLRRRR
jgi:capsular polysaccharide biosynthesis protein